MDKNENEDTRLTTENYVKLVDDTNKGMKRKWSKTWDTFDHFASVRGVSDTAKCKQCNHTIAYKFVKASKICVKTPDIRRMLFSKSQGSMFMNNGALDPKIFRDVIIGDVVRHNLPLSFVECESIREVFYMQIRELL